MRSVNLPCPTNFDLACFKVMFTNYKMRETEGSPRTCLDINEGGNGAFGINENEKPSREGERS